MKPSRHIWVLRSEHVERCERCGSYVDSRADASYPQACHPSPQWMRTRSDDDGGT